MTRLNKIIGGLAIAAVVAVVPVPAQADDQDVIDYRKHVMKTLGEQAGALFQILQQKAPPDNFAVHVKTLALTSTQVVKAFENHVDGDGSEGSAKSNIWSSWDDFTAKAKELEEKLMALDKAASEGGMGAAAPLVKESFTCKGCHDEYRVPQ